MLAQLHLGAPVRELARAGPSSPPAPVNILLVDDEPKNLLALEAIIRVPDRRLIRATSAKEALRCLLDDDFAVVLLDVQMPVMNGFEMAELIRGRERTRNTPIIFVTAASRDDDLVARGYALGAVDYIVKPIDPAILRSKVSVFVDLYRKTEEVRRQADMLAATGALLQSVLESATAYAIMALGPDGEILSWNEGARLMFGYEADEAVGIMGLDSLLAPDEPEPADCAALLDAATREHRVISELECVRKNGQPFSASLSVEQRAIKDADEVSGGGGFVVIIQDITPRKQADIQRARLYQERVARAEAEAARDRLQQVLDVLPEGILIADAAGRVSMGNSAAREIMGADRTDGGSLEYLEAARFSVRGTACSAEDYPLARAVARGDVIRGEQYVIEHPRSDDGVPVLVSAAPLRDPDGHIAGAVAAFQDISPIKQLERQKDAFLAAASHDLTSPLTIVKGRAQLLARRAARLESPDAPEFVKGLQVIDETTRRLSGMVNELLDVARLEMGRPIEVRARPMDLVQLVQEVVRSLGGSSGRHELVVEAAQPRVLGSWDRARLERVLTNLVTNAVKYSPRGGNIWVRIAEDDVDGSGWVRIDVQDEGIGIPPEELPRVFERFYRASNVTKHIDGAGVGLSGVQHMVELHGGRVGVTSEVGQGSTFSVWLPGSFGESR